MASLNDPKITEAERTEKTALIEQVENMFDLTGCRIQVCLEIINVLYDERDSYTPPWLDDYLIYALELKCIEQ